MKTLMKNGTREAFGFPSLIDDFFTRNWLGSPFINWRESGATLPAVNIIETNDDFKIEVASPGMQKDDFRIELENNILTISSEKDTVSNNEEQPGKYSRREFSYEAFQRSFALPENKVDGERIQARYTDGILHIVVPKKEEAKVKSPKQIAIS